MTIVSLRAFYYVGFFLTVLPSSWCMIYLMWKSLAYMAVCKNYGSTKDTHNLNNSTTFNISKTSFWPNEIRDTIFWWMSFNCQCWSNKEKNGVIQNQTHYSLQCATILEYANQAQSQIESFWNSFFIANFFARRWRVGTGVKDIKFERP